MSQNVKGNFGFEKQHFTESDNAISQNFIDWQSSPGKSLVTYFISYILTSYILNSQIFAGQTVFFIPLLDGQTP